MMRILLFFFIFIPLSALYAQRAPDSEIGFAAGVSVYQGDLTEQLYTFYETGPMAGIFFRRNWRNKLSSRISLNYGRLRGSDHISGDPARKRRNLSFFSPLIEGSVLLEYNFNRYYSGASRFRHGLINRGTPYIFSGVAFFWFNPKTRLNGDKQTLRFMPTEMSKNYGLTQFAIPIGVGIKYSVAPFVTLGVELGFRKTFTDYLDDVSGKFIDPATAFSQGGYEAFVLSDRSVEVNSERFPAGSARGNSRYNDNYYFVNITLSKTLSGKGRYGCPGRRF